MQKSTPRNFHDHRDTDSFGFSFESRARRHLRPDRLAALGVPDGPVRKELAEGKPVMLADGRMMDSEDVSGRQRDARNLSLSGMQRPSKIWPITFATPTYAPGPPRAPL